MAAKIKITKANGEVSEHKITPLIEYSFEKEHRKSFYTAIVEEGNRTYFFWLAWKCLSLVEDVKVFGESFIASLESVDVVDDSPNL
jgi:hypothetical protein